jgi:hypothetical protein
MNKNTKADTAPAQVSGNLIGSNPALDRALMGKRAVDEFCKAEAAPAQAGGHTPGPWNVAEVQLPDGAGLGVVSNDQTIVCRLDKWVSHAAPEMEANARLIASAPALLAALRDCADSLEVRFQTDYPNEAERTILSAARAALAQAEKEVA